MTSGISMSEGQRALARAKMLARASDSAFAIPGTNFRVGFDGLLGLIPGVGDLAGLLVSYFIILQAARYRTPTAVLLRMVGNVAVDTVVGAVPVLGDLLDFAFRANGRNVELFERHARLAADPQEPGEANRRIRTVVLVLLAATAVAITALCVGLVMGIAALIRG